MLPQYAMLTFLLAPPHGANLNAFDPLSLLLSFIRIPKPHQITSLPALKVSLPEAIKELMVSLLLRKPPLLKHLSDVALELLNSSCLFLLLLRADLLLKPPAWLNVTLLRLKALTADAFLARPATS